MEMKIMVAVIVLAVVLLVILLASGYVKAPPDIAYIISGFKKEPKILIGRAGISWREEFDVPELGFVIGVPWQKQGYAYEVCSAILNYAWKDIGFKQIQALVMEHNEKSAALCRKLGFEDNGITVLENVRYILYKMQLNRADSKSTVV